MTQFIDQNFVAAHEQLGTFTVVNVNGQLKKDGGNVTSYFLTPDARVIHAVTGPVQPQRLLAEAKWALATYRSTSAGLATREAQAVQLAAAHREALQSRGGGKQKRQIHQLLADRPLVKVNDVAEDIFTRILGETLRTADTRLDRSRQGVELARRGKLPMLFILHNRKAEDNDSVLRVWKQVQAQNGDALATLARSFSVISLPLNELPSLSRDLNVPPFKQPKSKGSPLLVITRSTGEQVAALTTWSRPGDLTEALANGLVSEVETRQIAANELNSLLKLVEPIDQQLAGRVRSLITQSRNRERQGGNGVVAMALPE